MKVVRSFIILATVLCLASAEYDELCARFTEGTQFREPDNCHAYVSCENGIGTVTNCPDEQLYNKDTKKCVATLSDAYCENPCAGKDDVWVADKIDCLKWYYCRSEEAFAGFCADGYHFNGTMCIYESDSDCSGVVDFCGILPPSSTYSDHTSCAKYNECSSKSVQSNLECKTGLYYDVALGSCQNQTNVACNVHPIPTAICGKDSSPIYDKFVADQATCRGYYYCAYKGSKLSDKNPSWSQCIEGLFFDAATQSCLPSYLVRCTYNRCDGIKTSLVVADTWGCRYYHSCENGQASELKKCGWDMFFSEILQACIYDEVSDPACDY